MGSRYCDVEFMKRKLKEWHPTWNIDSWSPQKIMAIYRSETKKIVPQILDALGYVPRNSNSN